MKRIDKSKILSTEYKEWVDRLERDHKQHPESRKYYVDVAMNLLRCQGGVCAYTEIFLCELGLVNENKWENGRYNDQNVERFGNLEHFDHNLKKDHLWKWENLFIVYSDLNPKKGTQEVDYILKPDLPGYDPFSLMEYDVYEHMFLTHRDIDDEVTRERVRKMIKTLQLNHGRVRDQRKIFFMQINDYHFTNSEFTPYQFFTAYEMAKAKNYIP
ncbi:MAG TPA: hypothetical protein VK469_17575 [Candidatus Kapabacteria bacterium]|nr:hypothetical protein [Candidatus Kapabacteria bacterium]